MMTMDRQRLIDNFEGLMAPIQRPGIDRLMEYVRKSDFYKAPASTKYHLCCEGGLLLHSLNVLAALREMMVKENDGQNEDGAPKIKYHYAVAGQFVTTIPEESMVIIALLHDICKTNYYSISTRNVKNEETGKWEKQPFYAVNDKMPLGHGAKSAMIIKEYIKLTTEEMYAIWWHMGFTDTEDKATLSQAIKSYPLIWALHTADMMASYFMEGEKGNKPPFDELQYLREAAPVASVDGDEPVFQEATAL